MYKHITNRLNRRDFLKFGGAALGGAGLTLGGCNRLVNLTAVPIPVNTLPPPPSLAPGEFADSILVNGSIVTMDAARTSLNALAVKNGIILSVGTMQMCKLAGRYTDYRFVGRTVTPD
jgi:hypothetical protein